mgnify:CR=1 FL=1
MRHEGKTEADNDIAWSILTGAIVLSPALLVFGPGEALSMVFYPALGVFLPVLVWALALGLVSTGFAYFGISLVLKRLNANVYSLIDIIVSPVVAAILGFIIFHEVPRTSMIYGGALLLASGFWLTWEMSKQSSR